MVLYSRMFFFGLLCTFASSANAVTTKIDMIGCPVVEDLVRADELAATGDVQALSKFVTRHFCAVIPGGTTVTPEKDSIHVMCVRPVGEPDCLWVFYKDLDVTNAEWSEILKLPHS